MLVLLPPIAEPMRLMSKMVPTSDPRIAYGFDFTPKGSLIVTFHFGCFELLAAAIPDEDLDATPKASRRLRQGTEVTQGQTQRVRAVHLSKLPAYCFYCCYCFSSFHSLCLFLSFKSNQLC